MPGSRGAWTPGRVSVAFVAFVASLSAFCPAARAGEPSVEPILLAYDADGACPGKDAFIASTRRYTTKWTAADSGVGLRSFQIRLAPRRAEHAGTLVITMPDGKASTREIVGPDCASVARGLAVVVALAIDPQAHVGAPGPEDEREASPTEPTTPTEPTAPTEQPLPSSASPPPPAPAPVPAKAELSERPRAEPHERLRFSFAVEARVEITSAVTTGALPVAGTALEMRAHLGDALPSWLSPSLAVGIRQSFPKHISVGPGTSEFTWTAATIRFCPVRLAALAARFEAAPCAELDVGVLQADARGVPNARTTSNAWFDRGASVRASYQITPSWRVGAGFLVTAPVTRHRYALASGELISKAPAAGVTAGLLLELRL
jgi:hypothetical protein